jgi:hypothetical protein
MLMLFLMFLIEHTTNRHTNAVPAKLDELVKATSGLEMTSAVSALLLRPDRDAEGGGS